MKDFLIDSYLSQDEKLEKIQDYVIENMSYCETCVNKDLCTNHKISPNIIMDNNLYMTITCKYYEVSKFRTLIKQIKESKD